MTGGRGAHAFIVYQKLYNVKNPALPHMLSKFPMQKVNKCPGNSSVNVDHVCPGCPVYPGYSDFPSCHPEISTVVCQFSPINI